MGQGDLNFQENTGALYQSNLIYMNRIASSSSTGYSENNFNLNIDASKSNSIYTDNGSVRPLALSLNYIIKS